MVAQAVVIAFAVALTAAVLLLTRFGRFALDRPNERSLHLRPVPRTGGIAILAGALAAGAWEAWLPLALALALAALSLADDLVGVPTPARLAAQFAIAVSFLWKLSVPLEPVEFVLLLLAIVWITNLYNFMDGSDGLAGGMAVIGFGAYALGAELAGAAALAALCAAIAAASFAFLIFNFHPARIFMGDVGSVPLGFLAAALGVLGWREAAWPLWFPLLVFGPFIGDSTLTLLRRLLRGERVWRAHREHYYQRMVRMGLGHRGTAWFAYVVMAGCAAAALAARAEPAAVQAGAFAGASLVLAALAAWVDLRWARYLREPGSAA